MELEEEQTKIIDSLTDKDTLQLLTFLLDNEVFGADISQVQEVLEYTDVTRVPKMSAQMIGVINLRGNVVPVIDLRKQFDMEISDITVDTCIVIIEISLQGETTSLGLLADAVKEVIVVSNSQISPPPRVGTSINTQYIQGMGKQDDNFIIILDLQKIFSDGQIGAIVEQSAELNLTEQEAVELNQTAG